MEHPSAKVPWAPFEGTSSLCRKGDGWGGGGERGTEAPLRYLKGASKGTLRGLRRLRRYLKGASKPSKVP